MIFSELYSAYYNTVAGVLRTAVQRPIDKKELRAIVEENAFGESVLNIEPALTEERWQLLRPDGTTPLKHPPTMPLTTLEKRWLKAVWSDPRIRLFTDEDIGLPDVEPLFTQEDFAVFDRYADGDPYTDPDYIRNFRLILKAIKDRTPLRIGMRNRRGTLSRVTILPDHLEYSEKDDKFRLIGRGNRYGDTVNLGRIESCEPAQGPFEACTAPAGRHETGTVEFELTDERNALERVLLHFAHFGKQAEKTGEKQYKVTVTYDREDETEMVIRILSFGPMVRVTAPQHFTELIRERLKKQLELWPAE